MALSDDEGYDAMLKIGVISDTHIRHVINYVGFLEVLDRKVFRHVDMILHAGDLVDQELLYIFEPRIIHAVRGNMDPPSVSFPSRKVLEVEVYRIGLIHGWGPPEGLGPRMAAEFATDDLDCLVYGHSHLPDCCRYEGLLLFNPGSATSPRGGYSPSVGLLEVDETGIRGSILSLEGENFGSNIG
ncbi:MAG: metallophosphoesterase [Pedobacter sp.]